MTIPVLQVAFVHPGAHPKQVPLCKGHVLFLQLGGQGPLHQYPYTPND